MSNAGLIRIGIFLVALYLALVGSVFADTIDQKQIISQKQDSDLEQIVSELSRRWDVAQVPTGGLSVIVGDKVRTWRLGKEEAGTFELASSSKAFTGLLIALLEQEGVLNQQDAITRWIPELAEHPEMGYSAVLLKNLLFHTSGISGDTIDLLQPYGAPDALAKLPVLLKEIPLAYPVGAKEEYATLNYSLLGLAAERATGKSFATLMREKVFLPLGMKNTTVEGDLSVEGSAAASVRIPGYKISFTRAQPYDAPRYLQNTPAGYVFSTPQDMGIWLQFLLHQQPLSNDKGDGDEQWSALYAALEQAKRPYGGNGDAGYAYGWDVKTDATTSWSHPGQNPNATAYVAFDPKAGVAVSLLGNSNSPQVIQLGQAIFEHLRGASSAGLPENFPVDDGDWISTVAAVIFWLGGILLFVAVMYKRGNRDKGGRDESVPDGASVLESRVETAIIQESFVRSAESPAEKPVWRTFLSRLIVQNVVFVSVLAIIPSPLLGLSWANLLVWGPLSLPVAVVGLLFFVNVVSLFFFLVTQRSDRYTSKTFSSLMIAKVVGLTVISGLLNSALVLFIIQAIDSPSAYFLYSSVLLFSCIYFYISARKAAEQQIMRFGHAFVQGWRMEIIRKLLASDYKNIEQLSSGKIQSVVGENSQELAKSVLAFVPFFANLLTIIFLFTYLMVFKSPVATSVLLACALPMIVLYYCISERANRIMPQALSTRSEFMDTVEDLQKGYKGLRREAVKRSFYRHAQGVSDRFKALRIQYDLGFLNAFFIGESLLTILLVAVALMFPLLIPHFDGNVSKEYLIILLYLIGPLNAVMSAMPELIRLKSLMNNMVMFSQSIQADSPAEVMPKIQDVKTLELSAVYFHYPATGGECFGVGPISLKAESGKSYFLTGGNGSGKSTLAMILAGLYAPERGTVRINGEEASQHQLLEQTRAIFSDNWLFKRVYDPALLPLREAVNQNIALLGLTQKATLLSDGAFDNIKLSTGQRKRLSLAMLLADPSPLVVLDEWAADQDPRSKARFYKEWLPMLKAQNRIVFVVTHDDEYFSEADVLITMKNGQLIELKEESYA
ncbi:serine hydrolase [Xenorhabdus bovienii]|uniref:serine hydrolase n=1 Tax=Xenorhabdus bovienii TaxID=40576 RepID=UPI0023B278E9|nr:serine hydrolase [Xenorhabdus bovienii]MDE9462776.1 serine hydrolase [Xenorhabdus bovienii]MDE9470581.1 serine hydrolase [Xenorhabdus bovienii]